MLSKSGNRNRLTMTRSRKKAREVSKFGLLAATLRFCSPKRSKKLHKLLSDLEAINKDSKQQKTDT